MSVSLRSVLCIGVIGSLLLGSTGCGERRADSVECTYLELLQLASHVQQQGQRDPLAGGLYRFFALRDRLVEDGYLVHARLSLPMADPIDERRHLSSLLWLFDTLELGRLSLQVTAPETGRWQVDYWIRHDREAALRRQLERLARPELAVSSLR